MKKILDKLTEIYCFVDDFLKLNPKVSEWRKSNHRNPSFSDSEILTIALMQSEFGVESLRKTYTLIAENFGEHALRFIFSTATVNAIVQGQLKIKEMKAPYKKMLIKDAAQKLGIDLLGY